MESSHHGDQFVGSIINDVIKFMQKWSSQGVSGTTAIALLQ